MRSEFPAVKWDDWYIDIMTAKLVDTKRRTEFRVMVLPNLYGDILTDEAAEFQGGVGTAGSANIGTRYSMFEAIHGSAPRMVDEGRAAVRRPQQHGPRRRDAAAATSASRDRAEQAGAGAGHRRPLREAPRDDRPRHRRQERRVRATTSSKR